MHFLHALDYIVLERCISPYIENVLEMHLPNTLDLSREMDLYVLHEFSLTAFTYPVSNFAYELLSGILYDPVFNVAGVNRQMVHKVKDLNIATSLRRQLYHLKDFIRVCRLADGLSPDLEQCGYLVFNPEWTLFSLHHLILLHQGELIRLLKNLLSRALKHVSGCQV
jgi:hypothetical protein